ncbi:unnamed protein product [Cercopithifilaria johnstoni]|uniref:Uncharacterized protein n=1 Tax=Cercopithifilaria johnstoni TaxID=2874296 RepID=A0A8J2MCM9_9BILA|nr:unnamed protein product [Cercopithifilaria johnstoni]
MWWSGDVRDYWLMLTILEMVIIFINLYCVFVVLLFYRYISGEITHYDEKENYRPRMYDEFKKNNYHVNNYLPELEHPVKSGYRKNEPLRRDQYNRLKDYTMIQQQSVPATSTHVRTTTFADDLVSTWVKEQQSIKDLPDHANSEPIIERKPTDIYSLKHSYSVPSINAKTSGARCCHRHRRKHCHHHLHHRHHHHHHHKHRSGSRRHDYSDQNDYGLRRSSSRHRYRFPSVTSSSGSVSTDYSDYSHLIRRRSRSLENGNAAIDDLRIAEGHHRSRRTRFENYPDDSKRFRDRRHESRKSRRNQYDVKKATSGNTSPTVAVQTDSILSHWPLDPQKGLTLPQQIIIPPSRGNIGPDGRSQPQTYQISSEIRISYDQKGRPVPHKVSALSRAPNSEEEFLPTYSQSRIMLVFKSERDMQLGVM